MAIDESISDKTHQILSEEFEDYDPEAVQKAADEWVESAPPPFPNVSDVSFEVRELDSGVWQWQLYGAEGASIADSGRTYDTRGAALDAAEEFRQSVADSSIATDDSP